MKKDEVRDEWKLGAYLNLERYKLFRKIEVCYEAEGVERWRKECLMLLHQN